MGPMVEGPEPGAPNAIGSLPAAPSQLTRFADYLDRAIRPSTRHVVATIGLLVVFMLVTGERLMGSASAGTIAIDLRIYRAAAQAAIAGGDPWAVGIAGFTFAGPPPTLLAYVPAALLPEGVALVVYGGLTLVAAVFAVRAVGLPAWWLLFPPIAESVFVINPDVVVVALLLAGPRLAGLSVVLKIYAAIALAIARRWRPLISGLAVCLLSLPWVPAFLTSRETTTANLAAQSYGGLSAWGTWLVIPTILALLVVWRRGAEWLAVPALWPYTQLHYAALALPIAARSPVVAFLLCFADPYLPAIATIIYAGGTLITDRIARERAAQAGLTSPVVRT
jgi:hypothetical protein